MVVNVALNYGGRDEIVRATRMIVERGPGADGIDERVFESFLDTAGLPDMDLVIRTSGEQRLSNFCVAERQRGVLCNASDVARFHAL